MTSRERVLLAANRHVPDRVPIFKPNMMNTYEPYDPALIDFFDEYEFDDLVSADFFTEQPSKLKPTDGVLLTDSYGCQFEYKGEGLPYCTYSPLADCETVADIEAFAWPDPENVGLPTQSAGEQSTSLRESGLYATTAYAAHLFHQYHYLRGFEQWMVDIKLHTDIHEAIAERIYNINSDILLRLLSVVGHSIDIVSLNDDMGTSISSYMSPEDFVTLIKPYYKRLIATIKGLYPHIKIYLHSHGQIMALVPDLIDCGVDILNPILPLDNMDPVKLKNEFGKDLCFHGGIDIERIVPFGTVQEVRDHVRRTIDILGEGGGYWFKLQVISPIIPTANIIAAYEEVLRT